MVLDAPETLRGAQQAEPDPLPAHVAIAPAFDVPRDVPERADQILDTVRRRRHRRGAGIEGEADPLLVVTDGAPGLIAGAAPRRIGAGDAVGSLTGVAGPED